MHQLDEVREALDREYPIPSRSGDWDDVLVRAEALAPAPRRRRSPLLLLPGAAVAVAVGILLWPWGDGSSTRILERARAVASAGPVVHLVLAKEDAPFTKLDLETGKLRQLQGQHEQWFDPERGFHDLYTVGGQVNRDVLYPAGSSPEVEQQFILFASAYREALESGEASVADKETVDGREVYWIRFHVRYPSVGIPTYDADHDVAVDAETGEPRVWREVTREIEALRMPSRSREVKIERWETLPAGAGDFTAAIDGNAVREVEAPGFSNLGRRTPEQARGVLSSTPLWLGNEFRGLSLAAIDEVRAEYKQDSGRPVLTPGLDVCYAARLNPTPCAAPPGEESAYLWLTQTTRPIGWRGWDQVAEPTEGTMIIPEPGPQIGRPRPVLGYARKDGVFVSVTAPNEELLIAAAQALHPIGAP